MQVRLLGTAAGGGFPQWNCNCRNCHGVRTGTLNAKHRTQSGVAVSADGQRWFLLNASPDIATQIENFAPLLPKSRDARGTSIHGVLLTNADLDHTLGLLLLREGNPLIVHATEAVRYFLEQGLSLSKILNRYCGIEWRLPSPHLSPLLDAQGMPSGLRYSAISLGGKTPRYIPDGNGPMSSTSIGYRIEDETTGGRLLFMPDLASLNDTIIEEINQCDTLLIDGTFWSDDEMHRAGVGVKPASEMGHLPVSGPDGSLAKLAPIPNVRKIYLHINNTNPMLIDDSHERNEVLTAGVEVGEDGWDLVL